MMGLSNIRFVTVAVFAVMAVIGMTTATWLRSQPSTEQIVTTRMPFTAEVTEESRNIAGLVVTKAMLEGFRTDGSRVRAPKAAGTSQERYIVLILNAFRLG
jgi:hypothetical protein